MTTDLDSRPPVPRTVSTPVEAAVSDRAWLQAMLDAEAALARAQARTGTMPATAAAAITAAARAELLDLRALACAARETANPVVGLVKALSGVVAERDPAAAEYVHRGSTSQDVFDTGAMLVCDRALRLVHADLLRTAGALAELAAYHRDTLMAGRTLTLHAVPTTFGLKAMRLAGAGAGCGRAAGAGAGRMGCPWRSAGRRGRWPGTWSTRRWTARARRTPVRTSSG